MDLESNIKWYKKVTWENKINQYIKDWWTPYWNPYFFQAQWTEIWTSKGWWYNMYTEITQVMVKLENNLLPTTTNEANQT
jgi:hypothetical protein